MPRADLSAYERVLEKAREAFYARVDVEPDDDERVDAAVRAAFLAAAEEAERWAQHFIKQYAGTHDKIDLDLYSQYQSRADWLRAFVGGDDDQS